MDLKRKISDALWIIAYLGVVLGVMVWSALSLDNLVDMIMVGVRLQNSWMVLGGGVLLYLFGALLVLVFCLGFIFLLIGLNALWEAYG